MKHAFIELNDVSYLYQQEHGEPLRAVDHVSLSISKGSHIAVLGRNGSGKSTLARLINALEQPAEGTVEVAGMFTSEEQNIWPIRKICGMVFQNPDNQIIGTTVEEDVAFGPENLGFPQPEIRKAVDEALAYVGLSDMAQKPPHLLSGGQKQKLAIAGILAMRPACIILDEATSMLDPVSCQDLLNLVEKLRREEHLTVINITHNMEEALLADQVYVMAQGKIKVSGNPHEVFDQVELVKSLGLDVPAHCDILYHLSRMLEQPLLPHETDNWERAGKAIMRLLSQAETEKTLPTLEALLRKPHTKKDKEEKVIEVERLTYTYTPGTVLSTDALHDVSFHVRRGELLGIIGHSGSGKSTLIQHLNGLLRTQHGKVRVLHLDAATNRDIKKIRQHVGLVFQYPEHQLFEETVFQDIAFGPKRMGLDMKQIEKRVLKAASVVGLDESILERSPFELSGGQKRRAAIAGVLAMEPDVLIMDEPAAGLDPAGRDELLGYADKLRNLGVTVILVSHSMEDVSKLADRVLVLNKGVVHAYGTAEKVFSDDVLLEQAGLSLPRAAAFLRFMRKSLPGLGDQAFIPEKAATALIHAWLLRKSEHDESATDKSETNAAITGESKNEAAAPVESVKTQAEKTETRKEGDADVR